MSIGSPWRVSLQSEDITLPDDIVLEALEALVKRPSGQIDPVECCMAPWLLGAVGLEFTPTEPGKHIIEVRKRGFPVEGSPLELTVGSKFDIEPTGSSFILIKIPI